MQVSKIQTNNHNASFGRILTHRTISSTKISSSEAEKILDKCRAKGNQAKDLAKSFMDNCSEWELKELAKEIEKKIEGKRRNWDTFW